MILFVTRRKKQNKGQGPPFRRRTVRGLGGGREREKERETERHKERVGEREKGTEREREQVQGGV